MASRVKSLGNSGAGSGTGSDTGSGTGSGTGSDTGSDTGFDHHTTISEAGDRLAYYKSELAAHGVRLTPRRMKVLEVLATKSDHTTADSVLAAVQERYPDTNKTTVYRTMDLLTELGLVTTSHMDGHKYRYELLQSPHHHLICKECGVAIELSDAALNPLRRLIEQEHNFAPCFTHFVLYGVCSNCQGQASRAEIANHNEEV